MLSNVYSLLTFCAGQEKLGCTGNVYLQNNGIMGNDYHLPTCLSGLLSDQKLLYNEQWPNVTLCVRVCVCVCVCVYEQN